MHLIFGKIVDFGRSIRSDLAILTRKDFRVVYEMVFFQYLRLLLNKHFVNVFHKFLYGVVMEFIERNCHASDNEHQASRRRKKRKMG